MSPGWLVCTENILALGLAATKSGEKSDSSELFILKWLRGNLPLSTSSLCLKFGCKGYLDCPFTKDMKG